MTSFRVPDAARFLGVSADTVRRWADAGRFPAGRDAAGRRVIRRRGAGGVRRQAGQEPCWAGRPDGRSFGSQPVRGHRDQGDQGRRDGPGRTPGGAVPGCRVDEPRGRRGTRVGAGGQRGRFGEGHQRDRGVTCHHPGLRPLTAPVLAAGTSRFLAARQNRRDRYAICERSFCGRLRAGPCSGRGRCAPGCRGPAASSGSRLPSQIFSSSGTRALRWRVCRSSSLGAEFRMSTIRSNTTVPHPGKRPAGLVEVAHTPKRASVAVGEQVEVTPGRCRLSPFLESDQHVSLDQRLGELDYRDVRLLLWVAWVHSSCSYRCRALAVIVRRLRPVRTGRPPGGGPARHN